MPEYRISIDDGACVARAYEHHPSLDAACAAARRTAVSMLNDLGGPLRGSLMVEIITAFVGDARCFEVAIVVTDLINRLDWQGDQIKPASDAIPYNI
ncbi:hypothetical protein [Sphingomonas adhaesiva]|uniref:hypothetical protein n=1 Tax=Sphingomonas adhaesiva TaxID=28212 RepID=UPI002FF6D5B2